MARKRLVIIDGYSLLFRAFYGTRFLSTSAGRPTNALFGFTNMLFALFREIEPDAVVVALDAPGKTFRHAEYPEYKGTRRETPPELIEQLEGSRELISAFNIPVLEVTGYEADDVVGTISRTAQENGYDTTIVTGDLDTLQLVDDAVSVMTPQSGGKPPKTYTPAEVMERYGFGPEHVVDYKAMAGDSSDNIPGVPGVGDKTATLLIKKFGTVEQILERIEEVEPKFRKKIEPNVDAMTQSKWLATIVRDVPVEYDFAPYSITQSDLEGIRQYLGTLEFRSQAKRLAGVLGRYVIGGGGPVAEVVSEVIEAKLHEGTADYDSLSKWVAGELGGDSLATGFLGGGPGAYVRKVLDLQGVRHDFVEIAGDTRTNFSVEDGGGEPATTFNAKGPSISPEEWEALMQKVREHAGRAGWAALGGSLPQGVPVDAYKLLGIAAKTAGARLALDSDGEAMRRGLEARPHFVKPNGPEAGRLLGRKVETVEEAVFAAEELRQYMEQDGVCVVSLGASGAVMACPEGTFVGRPIPVEASSTIGSGDSLVGGMLQALEKGAGLTEALKVGMAAGAATATTGGAEIASRSAVEELLASALVEAAH